MKQIKTTFNYTMGMMALAAVFSLGCSAPDATTTTDVAPTTQEVAPAPEAPAAPQLTDPEIAHVAVTANQIDIDYAAIAKQKSKNQSIIHFADAMATDHSGVIKQAVALATKLNVTPLDNAMSQSLVSGANDVKARLNTLEGAAFDKAYIDNEVAYHQAVIDAVSNVLIPQTQNAELKALLLSVAPVLNTHLEHAEMVQKELAGK